MVRKKIDNRIRILIENCVSSHHRSLLVIVGEKARDSVCIYFSHFEEKIVESANVEG
ncbi:Polycomb protein l(1)G0020, partial [Stegodyphus mimosarum]